MLQFGLVLVGLSSVLREDHHGTSKGHVVLGRHIELVTGIPVSPVVPIRLEICTGVR